MVDREKPVSKIKFKRVLGYATWVLTVILVVSTINNINKITSIRKQVEAERQRVEKMQADNAKLQEQIVEAQGADFIDKQMHDKLGFAKTGETVVVLPDDSIVKSLAPVQTPDEDILPDPNWMKWKKLFF